MTTTIRKAKTLYIYKERGIRLCVKCGEPFIDGELVVPKGIYTGHIPQTIHRRCYVDARGDPIL